MLKKLPENLRMMIIVSIIIISIPLISTSIYLDSKINKISMKGK